METSVERSVVTQWRELVARKVRIWNALEQALEKQHGLSTSEFDVLDQLAGCVGETQPRVQEIAEVVPITQSALSRLIGRLEEQGLVERKLCELDRRGIYVALTAKGRELHAAARPTYCAVLETEFGKGAETDRVELRELLASCETPL
jgi:DNA-binding MarR family transcriptional regulator